MFSGWIQKLLADAAKIINPNESVVPTGDNDEEDLTGLVVFNDTIEPGEQGKINGQEPGQPKVGLTKLRRDKTAKSWLFEKYYNMSLLNKNPEGDEEDSDLSDEEEWEHRVVQNVVWARRIGFVVETVLIDSDDPSNKYPQTYEINENLLIMIRSSPNNSRKIKSQMTANPTTQSAQTNSDSDSDSNEVQANQVIVHV